MIWCSNYLSVKKNLYFSSLSGQSPTLSERYMYKNMNWFWMLFGFGFSFFTVQASDSEVISNTGENNKLYLCLHNCALCVRVWESGLYNGEKCAKKCLKYKANPRIVDPECDQLKLFNQKALKRKTSRWQVNSKRSNFIIDETKWKKNYSHNFIQELYHFILKGKEEINDFIKIGCTVNIMLLLSL